MSVMKPISAYVNICREMSLDEFCLFFQWPFLLMSSDTSGRLIPIDMTRTPTVDRLVLGGSSSKEDLTRFDETFKVYEIPPQNQHSQQVSLGCSHACDVRFNDASVSRLHAKISKTDHGFYIEDNESTAGTALNGKLLDPTQTLKLNPGDTIGLGGIDLTVMMPNEFYPLVILLFGK